MSKYTGGRIVPRHNGEWDSTKEYEQLCIVLNPDDGVSYMSRKKVPAGTELSDTDYWAVCSQFSEQLKLYKDELDADVEQMQKDVAAAEKLTNNNKSDLEARMETIEARQDANVSASTDSDADYAAEVVDMRVDELGNTHGSAGDAMRDIAERLTAEIDALKEFSCVMISADELTSGSYINYGSGVVGSYSAYYATVDYIPAPGNTKFRIVLAKGYAHTDASGVAFYDEDYKFISGLVHEGYTTAYEGTTPEGCRYLRFTDYSNTDSVIYFDVADRVESLRDYVDSLVETLTESIDAINSSVDMINDKLEDFTVTDAEHDLIPYYFIAWNGTITAHTMVQWTYSTPIAVTAGQVIRLYARGYSNNVAMISLCDEGMSYITPVVISDGSDLQYYYYVVREDGYIVLSYMNSGTHSCKIVESPIFTEIYSRLYALETSVEDAETSLSEFKESVEASIKDIQTQIDDAGLGYNLFSMYETIGVVGDSLSSGVIEGDSGSVTNYNKSWLSTIARHYGQTAFHFSRGGYTAKSWLASSFYDSILETDNQCECYFIALGTNDANTSYGIELGSTDDIGTDEDTFYANYYKVIQRVKEANENAKLFLLTTYSGSLTSDINTAIQYFAENEENCYLIDVHTTRTQYLNGYHFNAMGYAYVGYYVADKVNEVIKENADDFTMVGTY